MILKVVVAPLTVIALITVRQWWCFGIILVCGVLRLKKLFVFNEIQLLYICFFGHLFGILTLLKRLDSLVVCYLHWISSYFSCFCWLFCCSTPEIFIKQYMCILFLLKYSPFFLSLSENVCVCFITALPFYILIYFFVFNLSVNKVHLLKITKASGASHRPLIFRSFLILSYSTPFMIFEDDLFASIQFAYFGNVPINEVHLNFFLFYLCNSKNFNWFF